MPEEEASPPIAVGRLWAEQLAIGLVLLIGLLSFMAFFHPDKLQVGGQVLTHNDLAAYGWSAAVGVVLQLIVHELGTILVARWKKIPLFLCFFPFGANAMRTLERIPRHVWTDAFVGAAGPLTGTVVSLLAALIYDLSDNPLFLCIACVGYFYNLFTLIPLLDLEGGWIAPAIAPQAWLLGLIAIGLELTQGFNLVLLGVFCFGLPRLFLLIRARAVRLDTELTPTQRWTVNIGYFALVLVLAWLGTTTFQSLTVLIPESMGD